MNIDELRVGNWVYYSYPNQFVTQVIDVCSHGEEPFIRCKRDKRDNLYKPNQLEDFHVGILSPIPLTAEILEKNGFVFNHDIFDGIYPMLSMIYCDYKLLDGRWINGGENNHIRYVHELQNALKDCKVERDIIL